MPSQVAVPLAGVAHGVHDDVPQLSGSVLLTQRLPQRWKPALHVKPHDVPSQVATEFAGGTHAEHDAPQFAIDVLFTHAAPHWW